MTVLLSYLIFFFFLLSYTDCIFIPDEEQAPKGQGRYGINSNRLEFFIRDRCMAYCHSLNPWAVDR